MPSYCHAVRMVRPESDAAECISDGAGPERIDAWAKRQTGAAVADQPDEVDRNEFLKAAEQVRSPGIGG
jgi:hypothetical protein